MTKAVDPTPAQIFGAVRRGAYWLTQQRRRWYATINVETINITDPRTSPPGLAFGRQSNWDEEMTVSRAHWLGLMFPGASPATIELANKYWKAEARARLTPATTATRTKTSRVTAA